MTKKRKKEVDFKDAAMDKFEEIKKKVWPKTKKELEKALASSKKMLDRGEKYLKDISEKGVENTKKLSLTIKREKLYYDLGRSIASVPKAKWGSTKKVSSLVKEIKGLSGKIKKIK